MKPLTIGAFGAKGSGKTAWSTQYINAHGGPRVMIWDYKHEPRWSDLGAGYTNWAAFVGACTQPRFLARYLVDHDLDIHEQFAAFCELAWREGNALMVVDELPEVTKANKAPPVWRKCVNIGRDYTVNGKRKWLSVLGIGQRLAEVDKSFLDQCDIVHVGRLGFGCANKLKAMWGVKVEELTGLPDLHWVESRADEPELRRGVLSFARKKPVAPARKPRP